MIDYNNFINKKISTVKPSGIRKFFDIANEMDDVISLSIGEPDFQSPAHPQTLYTKLDSILVPSTV